MEKELTTLSSLFGTDLDAALLAGKDAQNCQFKTLKVINKCSDTRLKEFVSCKKLGIGSGTITDGLSLQDECLGTGSGQPDPKGKIGKGPASCPLPGDAAWNAVEAVNTALATGTATSLSPSPLGSRRILDPWLGLRRTTRRSPGRRSMRTYDALRRERL